MKKYSRRVSRRVANSFGFGFLAATSGNLWFMMMSVTLWQTHKQRSPSGIASVQRSATAVL